MPCKRTVQRPGTVSEVANSLQPEPWSMVIPGVAVSVRRRIEEQKERGSVAWSRQLGK